MGATMYTNIWYDHFTNNIHLWWMDNGIRKYDKIPYKHNYWVVSDKPTGVKDMFGRDMEKRTCDRKKEIPKLPWKDIAEGDLKEEVKFLHDFFKDKELTPDINSLQVCYYDIECAVGRVPYTQDHKISIKKFDADEIQANMSKVSIEDFLKNDMYLTHEVWDIEKTEWLRIKNSCYVENDEFTDAKVAKYPINAVAAYFSIPNTLYLLVEKDFKYVHEYTIDSEGNRIPKSFGTLDMLKTRLYQETNVKLDDMIVHVIPDEKTMLEKFVTLLRKHKTDVLSGWSIDDFDNLYVHNRLQKLGSTKTMSPINKFRINSAGDHIELFGISVMDYLKLYRDKFTFDNKGYYSLNNISGIELNKSKLEYDGTIRMFMQNDWNGFCLYNCIDTLLVKALDDKKGFMNLALMSSHNSKVPMGSILGTLGGLTGLSLDIVHKKGLVLNNTNPNLDKVKFPGGVSWCLPGLYKYCVSFDVTSMYPHFMVRDNIGIETVEIFPEEYEMKDVIRIDDVENKRAYFFEPTDIIKIGRVINGTMQLINIKASEVLETDMVVIGDHQKPDWNYKMAIHAEW